MLQLIERNLRCFTHAELPWILGLLTDWRSSIGAGPAPPLAAREAGLIALQYWRLTEDAYVRQEELHALAGILLAASQAIRAEFEALLEQITGVDWDLSQLAARGATSHVFGWGRRLLLIVGGSRRLCSTRLGP